MKLLEKTAVLICLCGLPFAANATTDWTPLLKTLQNSCSLPKIYDDAGRMVIPKAYQPSVVSHKNTGSRDSGTETMVLKDAIAFGSPLNKFYVTVTESGYNAVLSFDNANFMKNMSKFYFQDGNYKMLAGSRSKPFQKEEMIYSPSSTGYYYQQNEYETRLKFDANKRTITCSVVND